MDHIVHRILRFDRFALDLARGCLRAGDREIDLRPQDVRGVALPHGERRTACVQARAFRSLWPNVSVRDDSLVQCIRELRQKLGDEDCRLIKTVSRRGYLLNATVSALAPQSLSARSPATERPRKDATGLDMLPRALRAIPVDKLRMWGRDGRRSCLRLGGHLCARPVGSGRKLVAFQPRQECASRAAPASHFQGLRRLPGDDRAADRGVHDGFARNLIRRFASAGMTRRDMRRGSYAA